MQRSFFVDTNCLDVLDGRPGNELEKDTDPTGGSDVHAGQLIEVRLTWKINDFAEAPLHNALDCVTVDGRLETGLSPSRPAPSWMPPR